MKPLRLSAFAAALVLTACAAPTPTDPTAATSTARFDDGPGMVGSGNGGVGTIDSGGGMLGSGNGGTESG
ncbi:MAG TPA: hypothetical protein VHG93_04290, partial [Longimicrobium sp.]|nr:hypothetical protein [Longimicrobium sp.]